MTYCKGIYIYKGLVYVGVFVLCLPEYSLNKSMLLLIINTNDCVCDMERIVIMLTKISGEIQLSQFFQ